MNRHRRNRSTWARRMALGAAVLPAIFAGGCEAWPDWDNVFLKRWWGWMQGDAGSTVVLGNQLLWVFGDSPAHADGTSAQHGTAESNTRNFTVIWGNAIAVHPRSNPTYQAPAVNGVADIVWGSYTGNVRYYGRNNTNGGVKDVTYEASVVTNGFGNTKQFFKGSCGVEIGSQRWPGSGYYLAASDTLAFFTHQVAGANWTTIHQAVEKYTNVSGLPPTWGCSPSQAIGNQYSTGDPSECDTNADPPLNWGGSVVKVPTGTDAGDIYIYGTRKAPAADCIDPPSTNPHMHLAKVESEAALFTYPTGWLFRYAGIATAQQIQHGDTPCPTNSGCWSTLEPKDSPGYDGIELRNGLARVASNIAPEYSVQWVTNNGSSRWILVHGGWVPLIDRNNHYYSGSMPSYLAQKAATNYRQIVMRSSKYGTAFPGSGHGSTTSYGSTVRADVIPPLDQPLIEPGTGSTIAPNDPNVVSGYNAFRSVHAVKGHAEISEPGSVVVTYYVWELQRCDPAVGSPPPATCPRETEFDLYYTASAAGAGDWDDSPQDGHLHNSVSSLRAIKFPLKYVTPWCTAETPSTCP